MNTEQDSNSFDVGDKTALVCVDQLEFQKLIVPQLVDLGYKVHLGLFDDDGRLKIATYSYDVVVVYENFKGASPGENPILREMVRKASALRREHFVLLLTDRSPTNDAMRAFEQSVDLILNVNDIANFKPVLRRAVAQHHDLYLPLKEAMRVVQAA
jgi:hypothetical protein